MREFSTSDLFFYILKFFLISFQKYMKKNPDKVERKWCKISLMSCLRDYDDYDDEVKIIITKTYNE